MLEFSLQNVNILMSNLFYLKWCNLNIYCMVHIMISYMYIDLKRVIVK